MGKIRFSNGGGGNQEQLKDEEQVAERRKKSDEKVKRNGLIERRRSGGDVVAGLGAREGEAKATVQEPGSRGTEQVQAVSEAFGPDRGCQSFKQSALLLFFFFFF